MSCGILVGLAKVMRLSDHFTIKNQNGADGNFPRRSRLLGLIQCQSHKIVIIHGPVTTLRNFWCAREDSNHRHAV